MGTHVLSELPQGISELMHHQDIRTKAKTFGKGSANRDVREIVVYFRANFNPGTGICIDRKRRKFGRFFFSFTKSICLHPCVDGDLGAVTGSAFSGFKLIWTSP